MKKELFESYSASEKINMLEANADACEVLDFVDYLSPEELSEKNAELATVAIAISKLEDEKKVFNESHKLEVKPLKAEMAELLGDIKHASRNVREKCYKMVEDNKVGYYNAKGLLVHERVARQEERQGTIMQIVRGTGTND